MHEDKSSGLLVSYDEREKAFEALGTHMRVGRVTVEEYGERAERLNAARTRGEVRALFTDLPAPGPEFEGEGAALAVRKDGEVAAEENPPPTASRQRVARALVPAGAVTAVGLTYVTGNWAFMFFTPPVVYAVEHVLRGRGRERGRGRKRSR